jgi:hypothetical protein
MAIEGLITVPGEVQAVETEFVFAGTEYLAFAFGRTIAGGSGHTLPDPVLAVVGDFGNTIAFNDDSWIMGDDAYVTFTAPYSGNYTLLVGDSIGGVGSYKAELVPYQGDVLLTDFWSI